MAPAVSAPPTVRIVYQSQAKASVHTAGYAVAFNKAIDLYHKKEFSYAVDLFHEADRLEPGNPECVVMIGICLEATGKCEAALGVYSYALQLDPHYALAWHNKAVLLGGKQRYAEARECYLNALRDRVLTGTPEFETVATGLASTFAKLGEQEPAARVLEDLLVRKGGDWAITAWVADLYAEAKNPQKACDLLMSLPNHGQLSETSMLLCKNKMADLLSSLAQPHAFRLPKAPRMEAAYEGAIQAAVQKLLADKKDSTSLSVADLDSVGWLAMKAMKHGCTKGTCFIRTWDTLRARLGEVLARNGYPSPGPLTISYFAADEVAPVEGHDLVINAVYTPASVPGILDRVKTYQDRGIATVPRGGALKIMAINSEQIRSQCTVDTDVNGFDLTNFGDFCEAIRKYVMHMYLSTIPHEVLTECVSLDIDSGLQQMYAKTVDLPVTKDGKVDAIVSWYDLDLAEGHFLSMGPDADCMWQQNVQVVHFSGNGMVKKGDVVQLNATVTRWTAERSHQWIMFSHINHLTNNTITQTHDTLLDTEDALQGRLWHFDMMSDIGRNDCYDRGLKVAVKPDSVVLDIGTGSGLLAMMAARAGAKHVYAIEGNASIAEKARNVIAHNGYADKITVINAMSDDVNIGDKPGDIPVKCDIVVTETMGADLLSELMYNILDDAAERLLKPGAIMIPGSGRVLAQLVEITSPWHLSGFPECELKDGVVDLSALNSVLTPMRACLQIQKTKFKPLTDVFSLFEFDFNNKIRKAGNIGETNATITTEGTLHAILYWWDADLGVDADGPIVIETGPESRYAYTDHAHWCQQLQAMDITGRPVKPNDVIPLRSYNDNHFTYIEFRE